MATVCVNHDFILSLLTNLYGFYQKCTKKTMAHPLNLCKFILQTRKPVLSNRLSCITEGRLPFLPLPLAEAC